MRALAGVVLGLAAVTPAAALDQTGIEAIARVVYADAGNQPIDGKLAVLETILNRIDAGTFGSGAIGVIEKRHAFEPVTRFGGWRSLPELTPAQRVEFGTIIGLLRAGALNSVSGGALYFQNEAIVATRVRNGTVTKTLVGFNGMPKTAVIGDHTFYSPTKGPGDGLAKPITIRHPEPREASETALTETVLVEGWERQ